MVVVCAWCEAHGRPQTALRDPEGGQWSGVSHEHARALKRAGTASHGICRACREHVWQAWGLSHQLTLPN